MANKLNRRKTPYNTDYSPGGSHCANGGVKIPDEPRRITISLSPAHTLAQNSERACVTSMATNHNEAATGSPSDRQEGLLRDIKNVLLTVLKDREETKDTAGNRTEWQLVALVLDRAFLILFVLLTIIVSLCILLNHPKYDPSDWPIH